MRNSKGLKAFLIISGALLTLIGGATLFMPVAVKAASGIDLAGNISILNDTRASAGLILALAILVFLGAFIKRLTFSSALLSFLLFLSLGVGRLLSITLDGMPADSMLKATGLEFTLGIVGAVLFFTHQEK